MEGPPYELAHATAARFRPARREPRGSFTGRLPARPNSDSDPVAYKAWLKNVSQPVMTVPPVGLPNSERSHKPNTSRVSASSPVSLNVPQQDVYEESENWSRVVATDDPLNYRMVWAWWNVPTIVGFELNNFDAASLWVGIGGYGTCELMQTGTEQITYTLPYLGEIAISRAWTEYVPNSEYVIPNFPVIPGYSIIASVQEGSNDIATFQIEETDTNGNPYAQYGAFVAKPSGTFYATSAECIAELPNYGANTHLSNYGAALFTHAAYYQKNGGSSSWYYYYNQANRPGTIHWITMYIFYNGDLLSQPLPVSSTIDQMLCTWYGYN